MQRAHLRNLILVAVVGALSTAPAFALHRTSVRVRHSSRARRHVRRVVWNPLFRGSHELLVRENVDLDRLELPRINNDEELVQMEQNEDLVPLRESRSLHIAENLTETRRYCRPWTRDFIEDFSQAFYEQFGKPLQVNSAVRTADQQKKLRRHNRNAAPELGDTASTHMAGVTLDISKRGITRKQHAWIEQYLLPMKDAGVIDPIEERRQPVFHIMVSDGYTDWKDSKDDLTKTASE